MGISKEMESVSITADWSEGLKISVVVNVQKQKKRQKQNLGYP